MRLLCSIVTSLYCENLFFRILNYYMKQISSIIIFIVVSNLLFGQTKETNPIYLLKNNGPWLTYESKRFIIYYHESILRKVSYDKIKELSLNQEANILKVADLLDIPKENIDSLRKISIWLFKDYEEKDIITKIPSNAFSIKPYWSAYYVYHTAKSAHEIGHLIINEFWGYFNSKKYQFLIEEGFANLADEGNGARNFNYYIRAKLIVESNGDVIEKIINKTDLKKARNSYLFKSIVAAAFVKFLIEAKGIQKFKELYNALNDDAIAYKVVYGKTLNELTIEFYEFLEEQENN